MVDAARPPALPDLQRGRGRQLPRRPRALLAAATVIVLATFGVLVPASPAAAANGNPPTALPEHATEADLKWQPVLSYDGNSCYNVPAIGQNGNNPELAEGLDENGNDSCRDEADLRNTNTYSRQRCNSGWCAYLYDYYFEKDFGTGGHRHDWEHVVVWVQGDEAKYVSTSAHGGYFRWPADYIQWEGNHPKVVYDQDDTFTHVFRPARAGEQPQNHHQEWKRSPLISYNGLEDRYRTALFDHNFDKASIALKDPNFAGDLEKAMPKRDVCPIPPIPCHDEYKPPAFSFDYDLDEGSPGTPSGPPVPGPAPTGTVRVMVVGDSMSQGDEGDWTWRYRLSEWFREQGVDAEFVGPYKGTVPARAPGRKPPTLQGQLPEPEDKSTRFDGKYDQRMSFDDDEHFAMWGQQAAVAKSLIQYEVRQQKPDLILLGLGFNDLGWFVSDAQGTLDSTKTLVDEARKANPNIKLAIANVPQRTLLGGNEQLPDKTNDYNSRLAQAIPTWHTDQSPVKLVKWRENYECGPTSCPAGYDGLHPNARGEYQIARAFTETLHNDFGYGTKPLDIPTTIPNRPTPTPDGVTAGEGPQGVTVNWNKVFGAHGYTVRSRMVGTTTWNESRVQANRHETLSVKGLTWEYQVRTDNGDTDDQKSAWSPTRTATANPTAPPGPTGIITQPTATGFTITWGVPTNPGAIERYEVIYWDQDTPNAILSSTGIKGFSARIDNLKPNHRYIIAVASWNTTGSGVPNNARPIRVGTATPTAPTGLQINPLDANTVQLTWTKNDTAAGYRVWTRDLTNGSPLTPSDQTFTEPTHGIAYLTSGFWNYEYCVTSINGTLESARTTCQTPKRPTGN
ncbi:NPP1 family protein [Micromonospora zamorensis]|uniref:NPP1 family protein n=1 Tax=Micromonospora zamorensis TaxID=709883 RepID=UPI0033BA5C92